MHAISGQDTLSDSNQEAWQHLGIHDHDNLLHVLLHITKKHEITFNTNALSLMILLKLSWYYWQDKEDSICKLMPNTV